LIADQCNYDMIATAVPVGINPYHGIGRGAPQYPPPPATCTHRNRRDLPTPSWGQK
jgi:hypothetical protein